MSSSYNEKRNEMNSNKESNNRINILNLNALNTAQTSIKNYTSLCLNIRISKEMFFTMEDWLTAYLMYMFTALHCAIVHCAKLLTLHRIALHCMALHCTVSYGTALHCMALHCTVSYGTALHCMALHCIVSYGTALHCTAPYCGCTKLHNAPLSCTKL